METPNKKPEIVTVPKKQRDWFKIISLSLLGLLVIPTLVAAIAGQTMGDSVDTLNQKYQLEIDIIKKGHDALMQQVENHCLTEIALAKLKLERHYAGTETRKPEELQSKIDKAEGKGLECRGAF